MLLDATAGLVTGLSLIIAIGAQNAFVLRQGLLRARRHRGGHLCGLRRAAGRAGVAGIGRIVERAPAAITAVRWLGVAFLTWYGVGPCCAPAARTRCGLPSRARLARRTAVMTAMALTWLNPHVYLDTVLLLGSLASSTA